MIDNKVNQSYSIIMALVRENRWKWSDTLDFEDFLVQIGFRVTIAEGFSRGVAHGLVCACYRSREVGPSRLGYQFGWQKSMNFVDFGQSDPR